MDAARKIEKFVALQAFVALQQEQTSAKVDDLQRKSADVTDELQKLKDALEKLYGVRRGQEEVLTAEENTNFSAVIESAEGRHGVLLNEYSEQEQALRNCLDDMQGINSQTRILRAVQRLFEDETLTPSMFEAEWKSWCCFEVTKVTVG